MSLLRFAIVCSLTLCSVAAHGALIMEPVTTFGTNTDGSLRPGDVAFLTSESQFQRGMAYNPTTGHLLVVDRSPNSPANNAVYILNGETGEPIGQLDNSSTLAGGNAAFTLNLIGVGDDGAIYVANLTSSTTTLPQTRLYRWASETDPQTLVYPTLDFPADDPTGGNTNAIQRRWGDTMTVRGSGLNKQILLANRGTFAAIFTPDDGTYAHFTPKLLTTDVATGALGYGLTFGAGNTFWGTAGAQTDGPLLRLQFDTNAGTAITLSTLSTPSFPGTITPIYYMASSNLLAGITMVPGADVVRLYDVTDPSAPVLLDRKSFVTTNNNNIFGGSLALGTNGVLYALNSDNGIMAFRLTSAATNPLAPAFFLNPANRLVVAGGEATFAAAADSSLPVSYQWVQFGTNLVPGATNSTITISNLQLANAGTYYAIASNALGSATSGVAVLTVVLTPPTTLFFHDPFDYLDGSLIAGQGGWSSAQTVGTSEAGSLNVPGLAASSGNKLTWTTASMSLRKATGSTNISGSVYFSFAFRIDTLSSSTSIGQIAGFVATTNTADTGFGSKFLTRTNGLGGYNLGTAKGGGTTFSGWATNELAEGETVFVVGRYNIVEGTATDDTCDLWVNPSPATFGASNAPPPSVNAIGVGGTDLAQVNVFFFRGGAGAASKQVADEARVGLSWADVTPTVVAAPNLSIAASGNGTVTIAWPTSAAGFNLEGAANLNTPISWTPVTNSIIVSGGLNTVNVNATSGNQFFRLKK